MYWTLELASKLEDAPWPATKDELIDMPCVRVLLLKLLRISKRWKMRAKSMRVSKIFGRIILVRRISSLMRRSINTYR